MDKMLVDLSKARLPSVMKFQRCQFVILDFPFQFRIKNCPPTDPEICGLPYPKGYPKAYCDQYANVPNSCPYMCGLCEGAACAGQL